MLVLRIGAHCGKWTPYCRRKHLCQRPFTPTDVKQQTCQQRQVKYDLRKHSSTSVHNATKLTFFFFIFLCFSSCQVYLCSPKFIDVDVCSSIVYRGFFPPIDSSLINPMTSVGNYPTPLYLPHVSLRVDNAMNESDVVAEHERRYAVVRYIIFSNTVLALPLNVLTAYLIIFKSPKHLKTYKYLLLNISFWVCLTDVLLEIFYLPLARLEIFGIYATGVASSLSSDLGFLCLVLCAFCFGEYLVALLFAFVYRFCALREAIYLFGVQIKVSHYWIAIVILMLVPPGTFLGAIAMSYKPYGEFVSQTMIDHPEFTPYFGRVPIFGVDKNKFIIGCGTIFFWTIMWIVGVALCICGIVAQFRAHRSLYSEHTYRMHMQLMRALAVQTTAPLALFSIPLSVDMIGLIFLPEIMNDAIVLTELAMSLHSTINSVAVITLIVPYRRAVLNIFYKVYPSGVSPST
uniref:G protein-coupled receptor n=1 Tax=Steinernema glaseri TaxID=37863 RepID=A0A1I8AIY9_9BILA